MNSNASSYLMASKNHCSLSIQRTLLFLIVLLLSIPTFAQKNKQGIKGDDVTLLSDSATLTKDDYLVHLQKVFETVNKIPVTVGSFTKLKPIAAHLTQDEAALSLLKSRLSQSERIPNLQNLQMAQTLLEELQANNKVCLADLQEYEKEFRALKTEILPCARTRS
jgi:potassium efflux system protein